MLHFSYVWISISMAEVKLPTRLFDDVTGRVCFYCFPFVSNKLTIPKYNKPFIYFLINPFINASLEVTGEPI